MVSKASDDFPEPLGPVRTTSFPRGMRNSRSRRLCSRAPLMWICEAASIPSTLPIFGTRQKSNKANIRLSYCGLGLVLILQKIQPPQRLQQVHHLFPTSPVARTPRGRPASSFFAMKLPPVSCSSWRTALISGLICTALTPLHAFVFEVGDAKG